MSLNDDRPEKQAPEPVHRTRFCGSLRSTRSACGRSLKSSADSSTNGGVHRWHLSHAALCAEPSAGDDHHRTLAGVAPTIDLSLGYNEANTFPLLKTIVSKIGDLKFANG